MTAQRPAAWRARLDPVHAALRQTRAFIDQAAARRDDLWLSDAALLGIAAYFSHAFWPHFWASAWVPVSAIGFWLIAHAITRWHRPIPQATKRAGRLVLMLGLLGGLVALLTVLAHGHLQRGHLVVLLIAGAALWVHRSLCARTDRFQLVPEENARWFVLLAAGLWLLRGFGQSELHGAGDALWYATFLRDSIEQVRHGIFPVFVGQSEYQFNGAIYPMRIAPAFNHLGALLDLATGCTLGTVAVQNLLLTLVGLAGVFSAYAGLRQLLPDRRWTAVALAVSFLACPGVIGIAYNTDLFMSWMTLPCVPLVIWGTLRSFEVYEAVPMLVLGLAGGAMWWGHSPIALWTSLIAGGAQVVQLCLRRPSGNEWKAIAFGLAAFGSVAAYPIGSVLLYPPEVGINGAGFQRASADNLVLFIRQVFPATFRPLSFNGSALSDFQLGYSVWLMFALAWSAVLTLRTSAAVRTLLVAASVLAVLLNPIPGIDLPLWSAVPAFVRDTTGNWAMNRLYLILCTITVFLLAALLREGAFRQSFDRRWQSILLVIGLTWSALEVEKFVEGSRLGARPAGAAKNMMCPENIAITRFAYLVFPRLPDNYSHSPVDPSLEQRLYRRSDGSLLVDNKDFAAMHGALIASGTMSSLGPNKPCAVLQSPVVLHPGEHYVVRFSFLRPLTALNGNLQLEGPTMERVYAVPDSGGLRAFGAGGEHTAILDASTSSPVDEPIAVRFWYGDTAARTNDPVADVKLFRYDPTILPVHTLGWLPYRATVKATEAAWLETPRMYQTPYAATVDGRPAALSESADGLVRIVVPAGESLVELRYVTPWGMRLLFWMSTLAFGLGVSRIWILLRRSL